ncbi:hypothetical protein M446_3363 [Methylobacterium sp. 4-46]|uniref:hypothetical protein n=1 Tax=unclassified Methylobacterium TaxID=2615210 RepID=UPI000165C757|nr:MULTISPECIES: hypothetical protein [Methylobacterium]ACA17760.1 hypothetical protein M446_3363 [Methylobacterium sp. 4-46]WFT83429.1 hypothetical protein QA634_17025 [Methylobacterium nodulans]
MLDDQLARAVRAIEEARCLCEQAERERALARELARRLDLSRAEFKAFQHNSEIVLRAAVRAALTPGPAPDTVVRPRARGGAGA